MLPTAATLSPAPLRPFRRKQDSTAGGMASPRRWDLALVPDRGEAARGGGEFLFLQLDERAHLPSRVAVRQLEHAVVEAVEASQGDELELVAHRAQLALEPGDGGVVQVLLPVEAGRAVVGQQLAGELRVDRLGELAREREVGLAGLAPDQVGVRGVGQPARNGLIEPVAGLEEALHGALAGAERAIVGVDVGREQVRGLGVGAGDDQGRHPAHIGGQARSGELFDRLAGGHQHLAAHVAALLDARQLVLEVHAGSAGLDHRLHQLVGVEHAAEAGLGIGHDRLQEVDTVVALGVMQLVGAQQGVVDALDHLRHRVGRIQRLVGVHLAGQVGIGGDLPAGQVDGLEPGLDLLHGLVAGQRAERVDEILGVQRLPQLVRAQSRQRVLDVHGAAQAHHVLGGIGAGDPGPARVVGPVQLQLLGGRQGVRHGGVLGGVRRRLLLPSPVTKGGAKKGSAQSSRS
jgi:hypothetical protein